MNINDWRYSNHTVYPNKPPHVDISTEEDVVNGGIVWKAFPKAFRVSYITDWDCKVETSFWYVIKDTAFDLTALKAKRRYEITKANRNFSVRQISALDSIDDIYDVYLESLDGYENEIPIPKDSFKSQVELIINYDSTIGGGRRMVLYGAYDNNNRLCGYAHIIIYRDCALFSQLKTRPSEESKGINAALCYKILVDLSEELNGGGFYISDGARNLYHKTHFQDYLEKYFLFRKAFCRLVVVWNPKISWIITMLYPFRRLFLRLDSLKFVHALNAMLLAEEISRECKKKQ